MRDENPKLALVPGSNDQIDDVPENRSCASNIASYIEEMAGELEELSRGHGLKSVAAYLALAASEAGRSRC